MSHPSPAPWRAWRAGGPVAIAHAQFVRLQAARVDFWVRSTIVAVALLLCGGCAGPAQTTWVPFHEHPGAPPMRLEAQVFWPASARMETQRGLPVLILNHGSPRQAAQRSDVRPDTYARQARAIADSGVVVIALVRRGYGRSDGDWVEHIGSCEGADYLRAGRESARDLRAAVVFANTLPGVDATRVALLGISAGGFASHALASASDAPSLGIRGVVNIAGGRGSQGPDQVCQPGRLVAAFGDFARSTQVPALWLYADNDRYFSQALVARMREAFTANGGTLTFVGVSASGHDGHHFFVREPEDVWLADVLAFLKQALR